MKSREKGGEQVAHSEIADAVTGSAAQWGSFQKIGKQTGISPTPSGNKYRRAEENGRKGMSGAPGNIL
jgi:hypothetical protein